MKKLLFAAVVVGSFLFVGAGMALADPIYVYETAIVDTYYDNSTTKTPFRIFGGDDYSYVHDIRESSLVYTYTPGIDFLSYANLTITLGDDTDQGNQPENFQILLIGDSTPVEDHSAALTSSAIDFGPYDVIGNITYAPDGLLNVTLHPTNSGHDFLFYKSVLSAQWYYVDGDDGLCNGKLCDDGDGDGDGTGDISAVPEPATMFLFGTGLVGLAGAVRRRRKK